MDKKTMRMEHYKRQGTLLSYFKYHLLAAGRSDIRYFNRAFLNTFIIEYNASMRTGVSDYTETQKTPFYTKNGGGYCAFLEIWNAYKAGMKNFDNAAANR